MRACLCVCPRARDRARLCVRALVCARVNIRRSGRDGAEQGGLVGGDIPAPSRAAHCAVGQLRRPCNPATPAPPRFRHAQPPRRAALRPPSLPLRRRHAHSPPHLDAPTRRPAVRCGTACGAATQRTRPARMLHSQDFNSFTILSLLYTNTVISHHNRPHLEGHAERCGTPHPYYVISCGMMPRKHNDFS